MRGLSQVTDKSGCLNHHLALQGRYPQHASSLGTLRSVQGKHGTVDGWVDSLVVWEIVFGGL